MKHGRRHKTLKEQAYIARQDAPGYKTPYAPIDVAEPTRRIPIETPEDLPLAARISTKDKKRLRHLGVDVDTESES
jgi:hypothetical protein